MLAHALLEKAAPGRARGEALVLLGDLEVELGPLVARSSTTARRSTMPPGCGSSS